MGAVWLWLAWFDSERINRDLRRSLETRREERDAWRASAQRTLEGMGSAVAQQFAAWSLTAAEREVALLLLKGRSHKEIARDTQRSERSVQQHVVAIYQKAGLAGRAELAAFFLEGRCCLRTEDVDAAALLLSGPTRLRGGCTRWFQPATAIANFPALFGVAQLFPETPGVVGSVPVYGVGPRAT